MVWTGISFGYRPDLHISTRGAMTAFRYRFVVLDPAVKLYAAVNGPAFVLIDDNVVPIEKSS